MDYAKKREAEVKKIEQAKARLAAIDARVSQAARKADTKRKVVLGGLLLDWANKDPAIARLLGGLLSRVVREQDRKAFEGWTPPDAPPPPRRSYRLEEMDEEMRERVELAIQEYLAQPRISDEPPLPQEPP